MEKWWGVILKALVEHTIIENYSMHMQKFYNN